jgi:hypothetical protein
MKSANGTVLVLVIGAMMMTACAAKPIKPGQSSNASPAIVSPDSTTRPAKPTTPLDDPGQPAHPPAGKVTVTFNGHGFTTSAPVGVVVANGLNKPIFTHDSKTDCSIIILQHQQGATWTDVLNCNQQRPPATFAIGPAHARTLTIRSSTLSQADLGPGTYRVKFTYRFDADQSDDPLTGLSSAIEIG